MMSCRTFARSFGHFWDTATPFSEKFVRGNNHLSESIPFCNRVQKKVEAAHRPAVVGEIIFLYASDLCTTRPRARPRVDHCNELAVPARAHKYLQRFPDFVTEPLPTIDEVSIGVEFVERVLHLEMWLRFSEYQVRPRFAGCGIIDESEGDLLADDYLIEFKFVNRMFRSTDYRQVLTYLALNWASDDPLEINKVVLCPFGNAA